MNEFTTFANRDVSNLILRDYNTKKEFENLDYANVTALDMTGDAVFAYGGQGHPKRVAFNGDKGGTLKIETQMQTAKLYSMMTGANIEKTAKWLKREEIVAGDGTLTLSTAPIEGSVNVYASDDDCGVPITATVEGTTATAEVTNGDTYIVYYQTELKDVHKLSVKATTFPKAFEIYGDTWYKTEDDVIVSQKMIVYKAQPQTNFSVSWSNSGEPATITITLDLLADKDNNMLDLIFDEE